MSIISPQTFKEKLRFEDLWINSMGVVIAQMMMVNAAAVVAAAVAVCDASAWT